MVPIQGHRERFGGESVAGGADSGTPGEVWRGKCDRWYRFRDTGRTQETSRFSVRAKAEQIGFRGGMNQSFYVISRF